MSKDNAEDINPGLPTDFAGAAEAEGVEVPGVAKQPAREAPKPIVEVTAEEAPKQRPNMGKPGTGQERVEFDDPAVEARFNRLYRQVKAQDDKLALQGQFLEKVAKDKAEIERKLADRESKDVMEGVREKIKTARDNGNVDEEDRLRDQLIGLTTELEVKKRLPVHETPLPRVQPPAATGDPYAMLSASDKAEITRWATAEDNDGNLVRPWASKQDNTRATLAAQLLAGVLNQTAQENLTMAEKLALVDDQMGTQAPAARRASPVMGTNLTPRTNTPKPKITPDQARIAKKLFPHLGEQEAYRAYVDGGL